MIRIQQLFSDKNVKKIFTNLFIYRAGPAEELPFPDASVQLVTACAAFHWFHADRFFKEVKRVLSPNGVLATYTYHFVKPLSEDPTTIEKIDNLFSEVRCHYLILLVTFLEICFNYEFQTFTTMLIHIFWGIFQFMFTDFCIIIIKFILYNSFCPSENDDEPVAMRILQVIFNWQKRMCQHNFESRGWYFLWTIIMFGRTCKDIQ